MAVNLDRKVQFQRQTFVDDGFSQVEVWADHGPRISAGRQDVSDGEKAVSGWIEAALVTRFTVRFSSFSRDLTPKDRLKSEGRTYDIQGIKEQAKTRRAFLEITAIARTDV